MVVKTLGEVAEYLNGRAFKPTEWEECGLPIIRIQNLNNPDAKFNFTTKKFEERFFVKNGDLLFAWSASLGAFIWDGNDAWVNQHIFKVVPFKGTDKHYLFYYLLHVIDELYAKTHGSGMVHITLKPFKATKIPLPPLPEQQRIVARIERLFEKLDRACELVQSALDSFETRKAAILHKAFTGELTAKWRKEHGVRLEDWKKKQLQQVVEGFKYGTSEKSDYAYMGTPVIRIPNISNGFVDLSDMKFLNTAIKNCDETLQDGDILIIRSNGSRDLVGKCALIENFHGEYTYASYLIRIRPLSIDSHFLLNLFNSTIIKQQLFDKAKSSAGINNINSKELGQLQISLPSCPEQQEIVRILDSLLESESKAKELCDTIDKIDLMKKSILARAFRGELGTNDLSEESAVELLKEVLV